MVLLLAQTGGDWAGAEPVPEITTQQQEKSSDTLAMPAQPGWKIDTVHAAASRTVLGMAQWIDSFFDDDNFTEEENRSRAKLSLEGAYDRFDEFTFHPRVHLRLNLPEAEERLNLIFSYTDNEEFKLDDAKLSPIQAHRTGESREEMSASLRWHFVQSLHNNLSTSAGISLNYLYLGLRYRWLYDFGSWQGRLVEQVRYYTDDGLENKLSYDIERALSPSLFFRARAEIDWFEGNDSLPHALVVSLDKVLTEDKALRYEWINSFETSPSYRMDNLKLQVRYRQRFYRDWLTLELAPCVSFPSGHNRDFNPGIVVRLEADFGFSPVNAASKKIMQF